MLCPSYNATKAIRFPVERRETLSLQNGSLGNDVVVCVAPHNACMGFSFARTTDALGVSQQWFVPPIGGSSTTRSFVDPYLQNLFNQVNGVARFRWVSLCVEVIDTTAVSSASGECFFVRPPWSRVDGAPLAGTHSSGSFGFTQAQDWYDNLLATPGIMPLTPAILMGGICGHVTMSARRATEFEDLPDYGTSADAYTTATAATDFDYGWRGKYTDANFTATTLPPPSGFLSATAEPLWRPAYLIFGREAGSASRRLTLVFRGTVEVIPSEVSFLTRLAKPLRIAQDGDEEKWWQMQARMTQMGAVRPGVRPAEARSAAGVAGAPIGMVRPPSQKKKPAPAPPPRPKVGAKLAAKAMARKGKKKLKAKLSKISK